MPFRFSTFCELLHDLETLVTRDPPFLRDRFEQEKKLIVEYWFRTNRLLIDAKDTDLVALLSTFFPEKRTDRVYALRERRLTQMIGRCLHLNQSKRKVLENWKTPGSGGLAKCVELVLKEFDCEAKPGAFVTVEEVDSALHNLAGRVRFSGPEVRALAPTSSPERSLENIFRRLSSIEAKWLTRLVLKSFSPVELDFYVVTKKFHFLLPDLLKVQNSFAAAKAVLRGPLSNFTSTPSIPARQIIRAEAAKYFVPEIGVKVSRQTYVKARSMEHCVNMCGNQVWSVERKYDGEFCEIHVDLKKGQDCIQIFSKSSKDSTQDRRAILGNLRGRLRIGRPDCVFKKRCIILGELVVWSESQKKILEFHHIRKHVTRSGVPLGAARDSQSKPGDRLMVILFDLLMLDDELVLQKSYKRRRERLKEVVQFKVGYAMPAERTFIDFSTGWESQEALCLQFAAALTQRFEGLVLKPLDMPYFRFNYDGDQALKSFVIKLKKDYLPELGGLRDVADFAIIGASFDPNLAPKSKIRNIRYTNFHLGCCINKDRAIRYDELPIFEVVNMITLDQCIPQAELQALNDCVHFRNRSFERAANKLKSPEHFDLRLGPGQECNIDVLLTEPCVVEVLGSGYVKPSDKQYFMLRHPRIQKLHLDRSWQDACSFTELQELANEARNTPEAEEARELSQRVHHIMDKFAKKKERDRRCSVSTQQTSPRTSQQTESPASVDPRGRTKILLPNTSLSRVGRRSTTRTSPVLVRMDTSERLPGEPLLVSATSSKTCDSHTAPQESFLTPPPTAPKLVPGSSNAGKRSHQEPEHTTPKRLRSSVQPLQPASSSPVLSTISNNSARRRAARFQKQATGESPQQTHEPVPKSKPMISCHNPRCPFTKSILYLSTCISTFKWVSETLSTWHSADITPSLAHWSRETISVASLGSLVAESYSYPGHQKIVLIESGRLDASMDLVREVKRLAIRDLVIFLDWRVLEEWKDVEAAAESQVFEGVDAKVVFEKRFFGFTGWDEGNGEVRFWGRNVARMPRAWLDD